MKLSFEEMELIQKALMSHRWKVEKQDGQSNPEFLASAQLMDKLSANHNGAELNYQPKVNRFLLMMERDSALKDLVFHLKKKHNVGDEIPSERQLEDEIGYSRPKMREALIKLECFGYIEIQHGKTTTLIKSFTNE